MKKNTGCKRIWMMSAFVLVLLSALCCGLPKQESMAAGSEKLLTMAAARALAVEESTSYFQAEQQIEAKRAALKSAQKAIKLKQISMSTFRWSPLLNFNFPTKPTEAEAAEFQLKPITIQAEIDEAVHKLTDLRLQIYEEINTLYVDIVVLQRTIEFNEQRMESLEEGLARNRARVLTGEAKQADVDALEKKLESTRNKIATDKRTLEADLRKLSNKIGTDVSTGYRFETPFLEAEIKRSQLPALVQYTLDRDQTYYTACIEASTARSQLNVNYNLMRQHYGSDINMISNYVTESLNGIQLKGSKMKSFKKDYDNFLNKIDSYWEGKKRILFIKIPRLWFKGSLDGTRYIDDDPYVLYQSALDYSAAHTAQLDAEATVEEQVIDGFENYVSVRNSYLQNVKDVEKAKEDLEADLLRNRLGELSYDEYNSEMEDYEELQNSLFELMKTYSTTLYSYDRLTCGGISALLSGTDASMQTGMVGNSYVEEEMADGASYYIKQIIQSEAFELSIYIPDDFEVNITDYELWCDNVQIGSRTAVDKTLRHLTLTSEGVGEVKIRLYDGEEFVDDCVIDPGESSGPLPVVKERRVVKTSADDIGIYESSRNEVTGFITITLNITEDTQAAYYKVLTADGGELSGSEPIANGKGFTHLSLVADGLENAEVIIMDAGKNEIYRARFDVNNHKVKKKSE